MFHSFEKIFLIVTVLFTFTACHSKPAEVPQAAAPVSNAALNTPAAPNPAKPAPAATFDGEWEGTSGEDIPLSFNVKGNVISGIHAGYRLQQGGCSAFSSFTSDTPGTLTDKTFTGKGSKDIMNDHYDFTINGTFSSDKEAKGTLHWVGKSNLCGPIDTQSNWTAKKASDGPDAEIPDME